ncbi:hypothetical protein [Parendozoicomonas sp. Alg238-R29]|uniref:hypothetical protein n=1 Tax=Parendozoicomonas sp. Alg238-R29 TaxID=2993446 RepID=UPI00248EE387|nr:hypothetical protein [Parendozoicomonas sp. Alg238-R29]
MGKLLPICVAVFIQVSGLVAAHFYYAGNPQQILVVVDSSYGLSGYQNKIEDWIDSFEQGERYSDLHFATDKSYLGKGSSNRGKLYRVSFGKMNASVLNQKYPAREYDTRVLLTFTDVDATGWQVVHF